MAAYATSSHSPRVLAHDPMTPIHSPHHSIHSSTSSRTPLHTLTLHEYRKQQKTPISRIATPPGKSLRRKAAGAALNGVERSSSVSRTPLSASLQPVRPLHISQSAQQLTSHQTASSSSSDFYQQAPLNGSLRSQSADPTGQFGAGFGNSISGNSDKVRYFKPIKKLPKPAAANRLDYPISLLASVRPRPPGLSPLQTSSTFSTAPSHSSDAQPTPSSFSLSRFPQPPNLIDPSLSPPHDENEPPQLSSTTFVSKAPETPPATPAVIHYRGASFDLVNPHDSLLFHDIVTPSREIDSTEYLPLRSSADPLISPEMAPKRPLYGDLSSAHASITGRNEEPWGTPSQLFPMEPTAAVVSPNSSQYTSPFYSPESVSGVSTLSTKKPADSRFSLKQVKQLTRSLTRKLGKTADIEQGEELRDLGGSSVSVATCNTEGEYPRPLDETYIVTPKASYFPLEAFPSKISETSARLFGLPAVSEDEPDISQRVSSQRYDSAPLTSIVPEEFSTQLGRGQESRSSKSEGYLMSAPYYDELASIYPSSSVYTGDGRTVSQLSTTSHRKSNPFRLSNIDPETFAYNPDSVYRYGSSYKSSQGTSRPPTQAYSRGSGDQGDSKTDTISKLIDQYKQVDPLRSKSAIERDQTITSSGVAAFESGTFGDGLQSDEKPQKVPSGLRQSEYALPEEVDNDYTEPTPPASLRLGPARKPTITHKPGLPPQVPAPLAPAFRHDEQISVFQYPEPSGMFSNTSSYGDTRNLLCLTPRKPAEITEYERSPSMPEKELQPSSSYSQPEAKPLVGSSSYSQPEAQPDPSPRTPQDALDFAEQIFQNATTQEQQIDKSIPAMWAKRNSGSLLRRKSSKKPKRDDALGSSQDYGSNRISKVGSEGDDFVDWETVVDNSQRGRLSLDSIADYSSSEGNRNSLGLPFNPDGSLSPGSVRKAQLGSSFYTHLTPTRSLANPFSSSPPDLTARTGVRNAYDDTPSPSFASSPPAVIGRGAVDQPYAFTPWADPYALSDKETQELLASGPNDDILFEDGCNANDENAGDGCRALDKGKAPVTSSPGGEAGNPELNRDNTFDKFSVLGPRGNLTGSPQGTGMHFVGSSAANTSTPGASLSSSPYDRNRKSRFPGFYATPIPATGSVTKIRESPQQLSEEHERSPSQLTIISNPYSLEPVENSSPLAGPSSPRNNMRSSRSYTKGRRGSRAAVPGQTKLRQMMLAPHARTISSSLSSSQISQIMRGRASTIDTTTPLRSSHASVNAPTVRTIGTYRHSNSPHILVPNRKMSEKNDAERRKLSWIIFALFCVLPPCLLLYRWLGDFVIATISKGRFRHCTRESKTIALAAAITVNILLIAGILVPIGILYSLGRL